MKPENKAKRDALKRLEHAPRRKGMSQLRKFLEGKALGAKDAIIAKCNECMGNYADGAVSCGVHTCPLFDFMPFKQSQTGSHA